METGNRKRTRDDQGDDNKEFHKGKKPETINSVNDYSSYKGKGSESVFDFPWLKESVVFKVEEYLDPEDTFASSLYLDEINPGTSAPNLDQSSNLQNEKNLNGDDSILSFQVDDLNLEPIDCIWNSLIAEPIENGNLDKGIINN